MKILHVVAGMDPKQGGVCQAIRNIIKGLCQTGDHHNEVVCLDDPGADYIAGELFEIHALGPASSPWCYADTLFPWLLENLNHFDSVIVHGLWLYPSQATAKALRILKQNGRTSVPALHVMPHGMLDPYFQRDPTRRVKALRNWIYWKLIEHKVFKDATSVLFTCEEEMNLARQPFKPFKPKRESVVGLGVEEPPAQTDAMQLAFKQACPELNDAPYLLFLSRIHPKKGVDLLIRAYAQLAKAHLASTSPSLSTLTSQPSTSSLTDHCSLITSHSFPTLVIAGPLDSAYAAEMQELASELLPSSLKTENCKLAPSILFPGMLRGDAKWGAFYGCEAFVLPSHQENFGIAVVEALACGKPVLITKKVNIWREIVEADGGFVADDSLSGVDALISRWLQLSGPDKSLMADKSRICFEKKFMQIAAARLWSAAVQ